MPFCPLNMTILYIHDGQPGKSGYDGGAVLVSDSATLQSGAVVVANDSFVNKCSLCSIDGLRRSLYVVRILSYEGS
jgi:hypothetical protein